MVFLFVLVAVYMVVFVLRGMMSKHADVKGTPVTSEVFPKIEVYNPIESDNNEASGNSKVVGTSKKKVVLRNESSVVETPQAVSKKEDKVKILLKSRSEAKRAFIHAEILNRKY